MISATVSMIHFFRKITFPVNSLPEPTRSPKIEVLLYEY
jgi:hypothetical protein